MGKARCADWFLSCSGGVYYRLMKEFWHRKEDSYSKQYRRESKVEKTEHELDPSVLDLDNARDLLKLMAAATAGQKKSWAFLNKMPASRKKELKEKHKILGNLLFPLG